MAELNSQGQTLADFDVWIIDDEIPVNFAPFGDDDLLQGRRPIDRGTLLALLNEERWADSHVKELCREIVKQAKTVTAFTEPGAAVAYLRSGSQVPDVIIYDLIYRQQGTAKKGTEALAQLLPMALSIVQVYTDESITDATRDLATLRVQYPGRLHDPINKTETNCEALAVKLAGRLETSLSAKLAKTIRGLTHAAIEEVLVRIDDLPLSVAMKLLAQQGEELDTVELVELLAVRIGETLDSRPELAAAIEEYVKSKGTPADSVRGTVQEITAILVARAREYISTSEDLHNDFSHALTKSRSMVGAQSNQAASAGAESADADRIIRAFFSFRLFFRPLDQLMRTGDIVQLEKRANPGTEPPNLYLVVTPACDLARFLKKTRGSVTLLRMRPLSESGRTRLLGYGNSGFKLGPSLTADPATCTLPSIPYPPAEYTDYVLFSHEITSLQIDQPGDITDGNKFGKPLKYADWPDVERICHLSEPFLSGVLAHVESTLFRVGLPDYPDKEFKRLSNLTNKKP